MRAKKQSSWQVKSMDTESEARTNYDEFLGMTFRGMMDYLADEIL